MSSPTGRPGAARELGRFLEIQNLGLNLPFAVAFLLAAADGLPSWTVVALIVVAFLAARNAGHAFNRWADRRYDAANPRTRSRALVTGRYRPSFALGVAALGAAVLLVAAWLLNPLALALAPVALLLLFGYSYTKRYTAGTTVFLGVVEAVTPAAIYIAVTGALPLVALVAVAAVVLWGTAFETIHSLGDVAADRAAGLRSLPAALGIRRSVLLLPALHAAALALFAGYAALAGLGVPVYVALGAIALLAAATDLAVARRPTQPKVPFRVHFALGAIFLAGVAVAVFLR